MENLILDSLEIRRFRAFHHLRIERLGRVNLITGKNNVGKSCLLEALALYAQRGSPILIWQLLEARDEGSSISRIREPGDIEDAVISIQNIFYGRKDVHKSSEPISIGAVESDRKLLSMAVRWATLSVSEGRQREMRILQPEEYPEADNPIVLFVVSFGEQEYTTQLASPYTRPWIPSETIKGDPCVFVPASGLTSPEIGVLWDKISLTELEENVLASLRIICPEVQRVNLVGEKERRRGRIPIVKVPSFDAPISLRSLGEGMNRLFGIALALVNARDGFLLVDEVESGLHYLVQPDLWKLIFQAARQLNVQVFATTHSWDCIEGFQKAAQASDPGEGMLIRLDARKDEIAATLFDDRKLSIATREDIEVR